RRPELFDERNARHAQENPNPDRNATIDLLRHGGAAVIALIARLSDLELDRRAQEDPGAPMLTTADVIRLRQIGHVQSHLDAIRTVLGPAKPRISTAGSAHDDATLELDMSFGAQRSAFAVPPEIA